MKSVWINAVPWKKDIVTTALESGADAVVVANATTSNTVSKATPRLC